MFNSSGLKWTVKHIEHNVIAANYIHFDAIETICVSSSTLNKGPIIFLALQFSFSLFFDMGIFIWCMFIVHRHGNEWISVSLSIPLQWMHKLNLTAPECWKFDSFSPCRTVWNYFVETFFRFNAKIVLIIRTQWY